jgi:prepilin-type N-terminal cleavage/methylation domain-containing protein
VLKRFFKAQQGFTVIEVMAAVLILGVALGAVSKVFVTGTAVANAQANQLDLRQRARMVQTQMEKDIQASYSVAIYCDDSTQNIMLYDSPNHIFKKYQYDSVRKGIYSINPTTFAQALVAGNIQTASFQNVPLGQGANIGSVNKVSIATTFAEGQETLNMSTNVSPRWNTGNNMPAIIKLNPANFTVQTTSYQFTEVLGQNTHFNDSTQIYIKDGDTVYASTDPALTGHPKSLTWGNGGLSLSNTTVYTVSGQPLNGGNLPFGVYDMAVKTTLADGSEEWVYAYSIFTCAWDPRDWHLSEGNYSSSGYDPSHFPYIYKAANNDDKVDYYVQQYVTDFDTKVTINLTSGLSNSYTDQPDAVIALWSNPDNGAKKNTYVGFGINKDSVFITNFNGSTTGNVVDAYHDIVPGQNIIKIPGVTVPSSIDANGNLVVAPVTLRAVAKDGVIDFYVGTVCVNSQLDTFNTGSIQIRKPSTWSYPFPYSTGYPGVTVPNNDMSVAYSISRL